MPRDRLQRARLSLLGLSLGDELGSQFFIPANRHHLSSRSLPAGPWQWTDDTEMACAVYLPLVTCHTIDQDALASSFARRHDFDRGYGPATGRLLRLVRDGGDWRALAAGLFDGSGSWGNGAAMRVAPLGGCAAVLAASAEFVSGAGGDRGRRAGAIAGLVESPSHVCAFPDLVVTQTANHRSRRLAGRLGFQEVGVFEEFDAQQTLAVASLDSFLASLPTSALHYGRARREPA